MSKQSKHERIIREELDAAQRELANHQAAADALEARIDTLNRVLARAEAAKGAGDGDG